MSCSTTTGLCSVLRQIEMLKSSAPSASILAAVPRPGCSPGEKNRRGLNAWRISETPMRARGDMTHGHLNGVLVANERDFRTPIFTLDHSGNEDRPVLRV